MKSRTYTGNPAGAAGLTLGVEDGVEDGMEDTDTGTDAGLCLLGRRAVLAGLGGAGLTALLTACGGGDAGAGAPSRAPTTPARPPASPTPTGPPGALVKLADVPVGGGVIARGPVLVLRSAGEQVTAYDAICPHASITIAPPDANGVITCPGHGGHFRASDGSRLDGPAPRGLRTVAVAVRDGYVVRA